MRTASWLRRLRQATKVSAPRPASSSITPPATFRPMARSLAIGTASGVSITTTRGCRRAVRQAMKTGSPFSPALRQWPCSRPFWIASGNSGWLFSQVPAACWLPWAGTSIWPPYDSSDATCLRSCNSRAYWLAK